MSQAQRKDGTVRLSVQTRINITRWAAEYVSGLVENHKGDGEDVWLIIHDLQGSGHLYRPDNVS